MAAPMKILVTGGRDFRDGDRVRAVFKKITAAYGAANLTLICGMAAGADAIAWEAALENAWHDIKEFRANWDTEGRSAGAIRNTRMLEEGKPDFCVAFPGGRGTQDMVDKCERAGVRVVRR
jgi:hypothetical protein